MSRVEKEGDDENDKVWQVLHEIDAVRLDTKVGALCSARRIVRGQRRAQCLDKHRVGFYGTGCARR
jgi:hypothetical protein